MNRKLNDKILISILPHLLTLCYVYDNIPYSTVIISSFLTSFIWHYNYEPSDRLLVLDYTFACALSFYEVTNLYIHNHDWFYFGISLNFSVLLFNKLVYILSIYRYIKYSYWHSYYHILSSLKTILLAKIGNLK